MQFVAFLYLDSAIPESASYRFRIREFLLAMAGSLNVDVNSVNVCKTQEHRLVATKPTNRTSDSRVICLVVDVNPSLAKAASRVRGERFEIICAATLVE